MPLRGINTTLVFRYPQRRVPTTRSFPAQVSAKVGERYILCSPKLPAGNWSDNNFDVVQFAYDLLKRDFAPRKIGIIGNSLGGQAASGYPASSAVRKAAFSATIVSAGVYCGGVNYGTLKDFPMYFIHDPGDSVVNISQAERVYNEMMATAAIQPFDRIAGQGHGGTPIYVCGNTKYFDWFDQQSGGVVPVPPQPVKKIDKIIAYFPDGTTQELK